MTETDDTARTPCPYCGGDAIPGSTCPRSITCPTCGAKPGSPCRRPSDHRAAQMHADRYHAAEAIDAAAGMTYPMPGRKDSSSPELEQLSLPTEGSSNA